MSHNDHSQATLYVAIATCIVLFILTWSFLKPRKQHSLRSVAIVVLGDIGRSPRMMYHAESFAENNFKTDVIGYGGSKPIPALERQPRVQLHYLAEPPSFLKSLPFVLAAPIKISIQIIALLLELLRIVKPPEFILVQNPPSIPTLALVWLVGRIRGSKVIVDWHNLGYSILALKLGNNHPFVRVAKWFERAFGRSAYAHLFVTQAMHDFLVNEWNLQGRKVILHDRPPRHFHRSTPQETHELFRKLKPSLAAEKCLQNFLPQFSEPYSTPLTDTTKPTSSTNSASSAAQISIDDFVAYHAKASSPAPPPIPVTAATYPELQIPTARPDRPALLVSSTSWTPDEDFRILLKAMGAYERRATTIALSKSTSKSTEDTATGKGMLPKLLVILTGKGPLRKQYMREVAKLQEEWKWVRCISLWLEAQDYPVLLGSADLGVCLHASSSALDLPMKVVDMFGCGLPVCALDFNCLDELVKDGVNGLIFNDATGLAEQLESLFMSFPNSPRLSALHSSLARSSTSSMSNLSNENDKDNWQWGTWEENWGRLVKPLILSDLDR